MLLVREELWDVVVEDIPDPQDSAWKKKNGKARASIGLSVDDNQLIHIKKHTSAKETWDALKAYHQKTTLSNKVCLLRKLCKLSLSESGDLEAHLIVMDEIMDQLATLGEPLKDELSVAFYLSSLPESYGSLIVALETRPEADLTRDLIRGKLLDESRRRKDLAGDKTTGEENALQVSKQYDKPKVTCYFCKKAGHIKSECRKYKAWMEKNNNKANTVAVPAEREAEYVSLNVDTSNQNSEFCIDSGASIHLCNDVKYFTFLKKSEGCTVMLADGKRLEAQGIGNIRIRTQNGNKGETDIQLSDVLFVPELKSGLISVSRLVKKGCEVNFKNGICEVWKDGRILFAVKSENDIYRVNVNYTGHKSHKAFSVSLSGHVKCIHEWHRVLGHRNLSDIRKMQSLAADMRMRECEHQDDCEICAQSKSTRDPFPKVSRTISKEPLDLIHTDLCGPLEVPTPRGNRYILTLIDDCSRYGHICLLEHKDGTEQRIMEFVTCFGAWEVTKLPPNCKVIGSKWVYKTKTDELGRPVKYKARLVAQGFSQKYGQHYDEVFAPVANPKILLAVAGMNGVSVRHYDVETAFLNADLNHEVYIKQPKGYATKDKNAVCRLIKNLYGLRQGAKEWNTKFDTTMKSNGYTQSDNDLCLYIKKDGDNYIYISTHVDDTVATATNDELLDQFENEMNKHFKMKNLGDLKYYLGIQFERDGNGIFGMYQQKYIDNKLHEFNLADAKDSKVPMNAGYLKQITEEEPFDDNEIYRKAIGSLLYLSTNTRPDIAVSTSILARRVSNPRQSDWNQVKRVFRYLKATKNLKLKLGSKEERPNNKLICYVDADLAGDSKDRKSNSGYFFKFHGATIGWASRKQTLVAHSTAEAEFVAISEAAKEAIWIERILKDFGQTIVTPIEMMEDNQSCIRMLFDKKGSQKTKHIDIKYKFIQDLIYKKQMTAIYCRTEDQIADILTKPLEGKKFAQFTKDIGLVI